MKIIVVVALLALAVAHPVSKQLTDSINNGQNTWKAMEPENNPFSYMTEEEIKAILGTRIQATPTVDPVFTAAQLEEELPESFDWSEENKKCVGKVRDQASCGSCWAFGAAEAFSDRYCIAHGEMKEFSSEHLVECDKSNMACNGGYLNKAWNFIASKGIVEDDCLPYTSGQGKVEACTDKCADGSDKVTATCDGKVVHPRKIEDIKREIKVNGPMEIAFTVYDDFMSYESGIYQRTSNKSVGGHAVKVTGWGIEQGVEYWTLVNSWGPRWGDKGTVKFAMRQCGIEGQLYACVPAEL